MPIRRAKIAGKYTYYAALFLAAVGLLNYPTLRATFEPEPLVYTNVPFPVAHSVHPGEPIPVTVGRCNTTGERLTYHVARALYRVDANGQRSIAYILDDALVQLEPGCSMASSALTELPNTQLAPGTYILVGRAIVAGHWRAEHFVDWETEPFRVVN